MNETLGIAFLAFIAVALICVAIVEVIRLRCERDLHLSRQWKEGERP